MQIFIGFFLIFTYFRRSVIDNLDSLTNQIFPVSLTSIFLLVCKIIHYHFHRSFFPLNVFRIVSHFFTHLLMQIKIDPIICAGVFVVALYSFVYTLLSFSIECSHLLALSFFHSLFAAFLVL